MKANVYAYHFLCRIQRKIKSYHVIISFGNQWATHTVETYFL